MIRPPQALTIAASDSGGGAGIQGDIKAIQANGVYALSVLVAVTAQNTVGVRRIFPLPADIIQAQMEAVFDDFEIGGMKTGMLYSSEIIRVVAETLRIRGAKNLVVDPVMISKGGAVLLKPEAVETMRMELFPLAALITPNIQEAEQLAGMTIRTAAQAEEAARRLYTQDGPAVLIKGGHLTDAPATDLLYDGRNLTRLEGTYIQTRNTHGTGCTYSAAIAAQLSRGRPLLDSIRIAKGYVTEAIRNGLEIGRGHGPTHHFYFLPPDPVGGAFTGKGNG